MLIQTTNQKFIHQSNQLITYRCDNKQGMASTGSLVTSSQPPPSLALTLPIQIRTDRFNHLTMDITPPIWKSNKIIYVKYIETSKAKLNRSDTTTFWVRFEFSAVCRSQQEPPPKVKYSTSEMVEVLTFNEPTYCPFLSYPLLSFLRVAVRLTRLCCCLRQSDKKKRHDKTSKKKKKKLKERSEPRHTPASCSKAFALLIIRMMRQKLHC